MELTSSDLISVEESNVCTTCGTRKPINCFHVRRRNGIDAGVFAACKTCKAAYDKIYRKLHPDREKAWAFRYRGGKGNHRFRKYGISPKQFSDLLDLQHNRCVICRRQFTKTGKHRACVHHCHNAGHPINILCAACNSAEGYIENYTNAFRLAEYMQKNELFEKRNGTNTPEHP